MNVETQKASTLIVLRRDQASFYEFLTPRMTGTGTTVVLLDRREGERRRSSNQTTANDRRGKERRVRAPAAALALMSVLGFMMLHRDGDHWVP